MGRERTTKHAAGDTASGSHPSVAELQVLVVGLNALGIETGLWADSVEQSVLTHHLLRITLHSQELGSCWASSCVHL